MNEYDDRISWSFTPHSLTNPRIRCVHWAALRSLCAYMAHTHSTHKTNKVHIMKRKMYPMESEMNNSDKTLCNTSATAVFCPISIVSIWIVRCFAWRSCLLFLLLSFLCCLFSSERLLLSSISLLLFFFCIVFTSLCWCILYFITSFKLHGISITSRSRHNNIIYTSILHFFLLLLVCLSLFSTIDVLDSFPVWIWDWSILENTRTDNNSIGANQTHNVYK